MPVALQAPAVFALRAAMRTRRFPAKARQRGWAWLSWAVPAAIKAAGIISGQEDARKNRAMQYDFAHNSLAWKAQDARNAGLHPLAALGASGYQASPVHVGGQDFGGLGQDLGRAFQAGKTPEEKLMLDQALKNSTLQGEKTQAEIDLIRSQINRNNQQGGPGWAPIGTGLATSYPVSSGDVNAVNLTNDSVPHGTIQIKPSEVDSHGPTPGTVAGVHRGLQDFDFGPLGRWFGLSGKANEGFEDLELAKYGLLYEANKDQLHALIRKYLVGKADKFDMEMLDRFKAAVSKPDWVRAMERARGTRMVPTWIDGKRHYYDINER